MAKTVNTKIQVRRDTSANWSSNNPVLASGEIGYDTTLKDFKIGDGTNPWNKLNYNRTPEFIMGTWTKASGTWTGVSKDGSLYDGKEIILYMPFAGSGNATLNLTMADGTTTGAKNVYWNSSTRFTTHVGTNSQLYLIYHSALTIGSTTYEGWWHDADRDVDTYTRLKVGTYTTGGIGAMQYALALQNAEGTFEALTTSGGTGSSKVANPAGFRPYGLMFYYHGNSAWPAGNNLSDISLSVNSFDTRYSSNYTSADAFTSGKPVYIKFTYNTTTGLLYLADTHFTQDLPTTEDGLLYMLLGVAVSGSYSASLAPYHPIYEYKNGRIDLFIPSKIPTKTSELINDAGYLTSYTETDPTVPAWAKAQNKPTYAATEISGLGAAATKGVITSIPTGSTSTSLPTAAAVVNYISQNPPAVDPSDLFSFDADTGLLTINIE